MSEVVDGQYQYIFSSPELLLTNHDWTDVFQSSSLCERLVAIGVIVDEAHCVKKW